MAVKWIAHVWKASPYSGQRLLLHLALADFANDDGECWPSHATLARKARTSAGWVSQSLRKMREDGLLEVVEQAGAGRGRVGRYRLLGITECDLAPALGNTPASVRSHSDGFATTYRTVSEPSDTRESFAQLWAAYPRKTAKANAERAFAKVMRRPDAPPLQVLLDAVAAYAASISDPRYVAHLATWLNGERWLDVVEPARATLPAGFRPLPEHYDEIANASGMAAAGYSFEHFLDTLGEHVTESARAAAIEAFHARRRLTVEG